VCAARARKTREPGPRGLHMTAHANDVGGALLAFCAASSLSDLGTQSQFVEDRRRFVM